MPKDLMDYNRMVETALRNVVRQALERARDEGLPGAHHFYLSFQTEDPGVVLADHLRAKYPDEMTIVIQHQFWGLEVEDDVFEITLSFNKVHERLRVPFRALTGFFDPSVQFGLQFQPAVGADGNVAKPPAVVPQPGLPVASPETPAEDESDKPAADETAEDGSKVVALDQFRKK